MVHADSKYWDVHWEQFTSTNSYGKFIEGDVGHFKGLFNKYLPKEGKIIEAGCGLGNYVIALNKQGYNIEGVEWAEKTVEKVKSIFPYLSILAGDVSSLNVPDSYYTGYISLGVMEHRKEGPDPFVKEAFRILKGGGIALISVPYVNPFRKIKMLIGCYKHNPKGLMFYQYVYSEKEFREYLNMFGFKVIDKYTYGGIKGLRDEIPIMKRIYQLRGIGWRLRNWTRKSKAASRFFGHMILFVCKKEL